MPELSEIRMKRLTLITFFIFWALYGSVTNLWNQYGYNLMHAGVEALAERGVFYLEGSPTPRFAQIEGAKPVPGYETSTDVFWHKGHLYPIKQPGMFILGAIVYKPLSLMGLRYVREYNLTSALVSWLTSGLIGAFVVTLLLRQGISEGLGRKAALIVALSLGSGSIFFPYSGVLHHDFIGGCLAYFAYYLLFGPEARIASSPLYLLLGGFMAGFAFTTSALTFFFVIPFGIGVLKARGMRPFKYFAAGYIAGILPLLFYNTVCFGNPFLMPNAAAGDIYTRPSFVSLYQLFDKFIMYFISPRWGLWTFSPVLYFAAAGLVLRVTRAHKKGDGWVLLGAVIPVILFILTIPSGGGAAFGPRYLLPVLPLLSAGLIPVLKALDIKKVEMSMGRRILWALLGFSFCAGVTICFTGALRGSMHGMEIHPFLYRLEVGMGLSGIKETPGAFPLLYPIIFLLAALFYYIPERFLWKEDSP